ncbi:MAG: type I-C CRISPR-associated protein Cas5c [Terrimicrobiaceae bacterium]|nr:type I-C CRISPR-associated protein Cas5c [Terrimicrobiaceae bacterium]
MSHNNLVTLRVWGDFACFTRPEMKVERVSYPVMTPSAARGILEAVFWEPQMYYLIDSIRVAKRGQWISIRRNEVTKVISVDNAQDWMSGKKKVVPINAGAGGDTDGTQRNMLALQDVEYLITAEVRLTPLAQPPRDNLGKYLREIEGRARAGKCFHRPGLGMREFAADFDWEPDADAALARRAAELGQPVPQAHEPLGLMLYDLFDHRARAAGFRWRTPDEEARQASDFEQTLTELKKGEQTKRRKEFALQRLRSTSAAIKPTPLFFNATLKNGCLDCHPDRVLSTPQGGN